MCDLLLHTGRSLEVVTEAQTVASHSGLREDLDRSAAAAVVADLLDKISVEGQTEPRLFALSTTISRCHGDTLRAMRCRRSVVAFLLKAMAMHGYRPQLEECACCAGEMHSSHDFSVSHGGVLCPECGALDASTLRFGPEGRAWLDTLLQARLADVAGLANAASGGRRLLRAGSRVRDVPRSCPSSGARLLRGDASHGP